MEQAADTLGVAAAQVAGQQSIAVGEFGVGGCPVIRQQLHPVGITLFGRSPEQDGVGGGAVLEELGSQSPIAFLPGELEWRAVC